jgi:bisanhydrobacterioruberin hydratase
MREKGLTLFLLAYSILWIGGVVSYGIYGAPPVTDSWTAAAFLWIAGLIILLSSHPSAAVFLAVASVGALGAEIIGVSTGKIFGTYQYTQALGFRVLDVPIVIAMAWCIFLGYVWNGASHLRVGVLTKAGIGALWMTCLDLVVDPLAAGPLAYWRWTEGGWYQGIPISNFMGWFVVSFVLLLILNRRLAQNPLAHIVGLSVLLFFTLLAAIKSMVVPAAIGSVLMILDIAFVPREQSAFTNRIKGVISRKMSWISVIALFSLVSALHTPLLLAESNVREQLSSAKRLLREGSVLNDETLVLRGYEIIKSLHEQAPSTTTLYFVAQAEWELVRLGLDAKDRRIYEQYIDGAVEKAKEIVEQRKDWSEGHALLSSLLGYRIAYSPLNAIMSGPKANRSAEEAVRLDSTNARAWMVRGIMKFNTPALFGGDKEQAIVSLLKAVELYEHRPTPDWDEPEWGYLDALLWLGWAYEQSDRPHDANALYRKALRAEPRATWIQKKFLSPLESRSGSASASGQ